MTQLTKESIIPYVLGEAAKSNVDKRKVGCVIVDRELSIIGVGHNTSQVHAEVAAITDAIANKSTIRKYIVDSNEFTAYVTHQPCPDCARQLIDNNVNKVIVVDAFLKFDTDKVRYDLVPPLALLELAKVLTYGASKYKPGNWRECTDLDRYVGAAMRHMEAYRMGEYADAESGLPHLAHVMCNLAFLIDLNSIKKAPESSLNE